MQNGSIKKNQYSIQEKLKVLEKIKINLNHPIARKYGLDRKTIGNYKEKEEILKSQGNLRNIEYEEMGLNLNYKAKSKKNLLIGFIIEKA